MQRKILHIISSKAFGGLELYVSQLIKQLEKFGLKNYLMCRKHSRIEKELEGSGVIINYCRSDFYFNLFDIHSIQKLIRKEKIDILHTHTHYDVWKASLARILLKGIPHINSLYMLPTEKKDPLHRFIYSKVDAIVSSSLVSNLLIEKNYPIDKNKIHLIRYGRDVEKYTKNLNKRAEIRNKWNCKEDEVVVMSMSRIDEQKGLREFALSFNFFPNHIKEKVRFWIVGEPTIANIDNYGNPSYELESQNLYDWLKDFISKPEINGRITLIPFQKDFIDYLGSADIFILPSRNEMYSLSVIDAMLMGLPVIGTKAEGTQEQINDKVNGLLVDVNSPKQIAEAVIELIENPDIRLGIVNNARLFALKEHNWTKTIQEWLALYHNAILQYKNY